MVNTDSYFFVYEVDDDNKDFNIRGVPYGPGFRHSLPAEKDGSAQTMA